MTANVKKARKPHVSQLLNQCDVSSKFLILQQEESAKEEADNLAENPASVSRSERSKADYPVTEPMPMDCSTDSKEPSVPVNAENHEMSGDKPGHVLPHKRAPPHSSEGSSEAKESAPDLPNPKRVKHTVHVLQTTDGWVEVDKAKQQELKEKENTEGAASSSGPVAQPSDDPKPVATESVRAASEETLKGDAVATGTAQWQQYAGYTPEGRGNTVGFTVLQSRILVSNLSR